MGLKGGRPGVLDGQDTQQRVAEVVKEALHCYEDVFQDRDLYLCGEKQGLLDVEMAPVLELSLNMLQSSLLERLGIVYLEDIAPRTMDYLNRMKDRGSWSVAYGGGGSNGFAAMVRSQIRTGLGLLAKEKSEKQQLYKQMLFEARSTWPPAVNTSGTYSDVVEREQASRTFTARRGSESIADVKLCM